MNDSVPGYFRYWGEDGEGKNGSIIDLLIRTSSNCHLYSSELENKFSDIKCDGFVCRPRHFIAVTVGADLCVRPVASVDDIHSDSHGQTRRSAPTMAPTMALSMTTAMNEHAGWPWTAWFNGSKS